ncbi:MAG: stage II sporulation protein M [Chloroflexi bacterium]|nr:stage II sporulation protein M [Chloroflexota bacterium]
MRTFLLAFVIFTAALALGTQVSPTASANLLRQLAEAVEPIAAVHPLWLLVIILLNNSLKALAVILFGVLLALPPLFFLVLNGLTIGMVVSVLKTSAGYGVVIAGLAPHGVIEVPLIVLASGIGIKVGLESLAWLKGARSKVKSQLASGLKTYVKWVLPGLTLAATIEVFITPLVVRAVQGG